MHQQLQVLTYTVIMVDMISWLILLGLSPSSNAYVNYGTKFETNVSLSNLEFFSSILRTTVGVDSVARCMILCDIDKCGSFSYQSDSEICRTFGKRFCDAKDATNASSRTQYFAIDDDSKINGCNKPKDCQDIQNFCSNYSGVYTIHTDSTGGELDVFCDMRSDGGWTVFQRRMDGSENFYRTWNDYKNGFGEICSEFWLGNDLLHIITNSGQYELRIDMEDFDGIEKYVKYSSFHIGDEQSGYILTVSGYTGNTGDSFAYHNGNKFSTKDRDNNKKCAERFSGAWWYVACYSSNLNGLYLGGASSSAKGATWRAFRGLNYSLKTISMKIRKKH